MSVAQSAASSISTPNVKVKVCTFRALWYSAPVTDAWFIVIEAYSRSLRLVFISAIVIFVIVNALVFSIQLPHLKKKEASSEDGDENGR